MANLCGHPVCPVTKRAARLYMLKGAWRLGNPDGCGWSVSFYTSQRYRVQMRASSPEGGLRRSLFDIDEEPARNGER